MTMKHDDILELASWTRELLTELHTKRQVFNHALAGACGVGAYLNQQLLRQVLNIKTADFVMAEGKWGGHCWTEVWINSACYVLDVTATQFGHGIPRIVWETKEEYQEYPFLDDIDRGQWMNDEAFRRFSRWTQEQTPHFYMDDIRRAFPGLELPTVSSLASAW